MRSPCILGFICYYTEAMENNEKDKKKYEISFLLKSEDEIPGVVSFLGQHNAEIVIEPRAKKLALAYKIKDNEEAFFVYCTVLAAGSDVKALEKDFTMRPEVIRSLIVALPTTLRRATGSENTGEKKDRPMRSAPSTQTNIVSSHSLSNEALEKKIEEILK